VESERTKALKLKLVGLNAVRQLLEIHRMGLKSMTGIEDEDELAAVDDCLVELMTGIDRKYQTVESSLAVSQVCDKERARTKFQGELTHELLRNTLKYDSVLGSFSSQGEDGFFNVQAAHVEGGRLVVKLFGTTYMAQRLAWFYLTGEWPHGVNVLDGDWLNCKMNNLLEATK